MKTSQPRRARKKAYQAPLHRRRKFLSAHLSEPLLLKFNRRSVVLRKGDTVRVMRGEFRGTVGKVLSVDVRRGKVTVEKVTVKNAKGTEKPRPLSPSILLVTKLDLSDPRRRERLGATEADVEKETEPSAPQPTPTRQATESSPKGGEES